MNLTFSIKSKKYIFYMFGFHFKFGADGAVAAAVLAYMCLYGPILGLIRAYTGKRKFHGFETSVIQPFWECHCNDTFCNRYLL